MSTGCSNSVRRVGVVDDADRDGGSPGRQSPRSPADATPSGLWIDRHRGHGVDEGETRAARVTTVSQSVAMSALPGELHQARLGAERLGDRGDDLARRPGSSPNCRPVAFGQDTFSSTRASRRAASDPNAVATST